MNAEESYREYLTRIWITATVSDVQKHRKNPWTRAKRWIERRFTK